MRILSTGGGGGGGLFGIIILDEAEVAGELDDEEERDAEVEALWLNTGPFPDPDRVLRLSFRADRMP